MQAKNLKKQAAAKARSTALTPAQRSKIAAKAALKKAGYPSAEYVGTLSLGKLFKKPCCQAECSMEELFNGQLSFADIEAEQFLQIRRTHADRRVNAMDRLTDDVRNRA